MHFLMGSFLRRGLKGWVEVSFLFSLFGFIISFRFVSFLIFSFVFRLFVWSVSRIRMLILLHCFGRSINFGEGVVGGEPLVVNVPHPRTMYLLTYLGRSPPSPH